MRKGLFSRGARINPPNRFASTFLEKDSDCDSRSASAFVKKDSECDPRSASTFLQKDSECDSRSASAFVKKNSECDSRFASAFVEKDSDCGSRSASTFLEKDSECDSRSASAFVKKDSECDSRSASAFAEKDSDCGSRSAPAFLEKDSDCDSRFASTFLQKDSECDSRFASAYAEKDSESDFRPIDSVQTQVLVDHSRSILSKNTSPDIGFTYGLNPYRGCEHGCAYCFARPTHETLSFNAGLDFESKIMIKPNAPALLRQALMKPSWQGEVIAMSGVTDCYQPLERTYRITRGCLEVLAEFRNPVSLITKNVLILRDLDILAPMAEQNLVQVFLSVTTLDKDLARKLEPRTPPPALRLQAIRRLVAAGVPVGVNVAPIIPGLTDKELPRILEACAEAGAKTAGCVLLRLPLAVKPIFLDWLDHHVPLRAQHIRTRIKDTRQGEMYDHRWGLRQTGEGPFAEQIQKLFQIFTKKYGLDGDLPPLDSSRFRRPGTWVQRELFKELS